MKILVVDDEQRICRDTKNYLERLGYSVITESDGTKTLQRIEEESPSIVVLDVALNLKHTDGVTLCSEICRLPAHKSNNMGIILISGEFIRPPDEIKGLKLGADSYLTKPFELNKLEATIDALGRRINHKESPIIYTDTNLTVNSALRSVKLGDKIVELTTIEFDLLAYLIRSRPEALSKDRLINDIWNNEEIEEKVLTKYISAVRSKVSPNKREQYIKTISGFGYKFDPEDIR